MVALSNEYPTHTKSINISFIRSHIRHYLNNVFSSISYI